MAVSEQQLAEASAWLDAQAASAQQLRDAAEQAARQAWAGFTDWYTVQAVNAIAGEMAHLSQASQDVMVGAAQHYVAGVTAALRGTPVMIPRTTIPPVRGESSPPSLVHTRPAEAYRRAIALGKDHEEAVAIALDRAADLQVGDLSLAERYAQQSLMKELGITEFRRVVRPELAKTGSCGLCIAASDQVYKTSLLMPMHGNCNCKLMPIIGDQDPGNSLNNLDLGQLYDNAGDTTSGRELKKTRYQVNEHGEYGPVLSKAGDSFRGPGGVALEDDPKRAIRMLGKALPVLDRLEAAGAAEGPLKYQRELVARLTRIVLAA